MNLVEKILARASKRKSVTPGDVVVAEIEGSFLHDLSSRSCRVVFENQVGGKIANPERIVVVFDHQFSPPTEDKAETLLKTREFCYKHGIKLYDCGSGQLHVTCMQNGHVKPGAMLVGSDSHSPVHGVMGAFSAALGNDSYAAMVMAHSNCWFRVPEAISIELVGEPKAGTTARDVALWLCAQIGEGNGNYFAIKFHGEYVKALSFWDRWLFPLMAVDVGAKCAYIEPDETTIAFADSLGLTDYEIVRDDPNTPFAKSWRYDVSDVEPQICFPPTVGNVRPIREFAGTKVNWAELGGHGGGRSEDVAMAVRIMRERPKHERVNFNIVPSSRHVFSEAVKDGSVGLLFERGATWFPPSTGSNQAVNMGAMAAGEVTISTQARTFPGRNGSPKSCMYLASALSVAAAAVAGKIVDPREML